MDIVVSVLLYFICLPTSFGKYFILALVLFCFFNVSNTGLINLSFLFIISAFGVDAAFSYKYNQRLGVCDKDGLAICPGFTTTHVIPVCFLSLAFSIEEQAFYINIYPGFIWLMFNHVLEQP